MAQRKRLSDEAYKTLILNDEEFFKHCLKIRTKEHGVQPLVLNSAQKQVAAEIEQMRDELGYVRVVIVKGRQMGVSTYVDARFYKRVSTSRGVTAQIVTHEDRATQNLFGMTRRYHDNNIPDLKPTTGSANANELTFSKLDSGFKVATAGAKSAGRSSTIQLLHASEFDYWPEATAEEVWTGLSEAVPERGEGTEIIVESTAKEPAGILNRLVKAALAGKTDFRLIFIPWFRHEEYVNHDYQRIEGFRFPKEFREYQAAHGLTDAQLYWAYRKNQNMVAIGGLPDDKFCTQFKREYPATVHEAFEAAGDDEKRVFPKAWIEQAQARWRARRDEALADCQEGEEPDYGPQTGLGVDVAQGGLDLSTVAEFYGARLERIQKKPGKDTPEVSDVSEMVMKHRRGSAMVMVDTTGGYGGGVVTFLKRNENVDVAGVNSSTGSEKRDTEMDAGYLNMRTELAWEFRLALDPESGEDIELPDDPKLTEEMLAYEYELRANGSIQIIAKEKLRKKLGRSPDDLDAVLLGWKATKKHSKRVRRNKMQAKAGRMSGSGMGHRVVTGRRPVAGQRRT